MSFNEQNRGELEKRISELENRISETETALRKKELLYNAIIENSPNVVWMKDKCGRYIMANPRFLGAIKNDAEEIVGKTEIELKCGKIAALFAEGDNKVIETGITIVLEVELPEADSEALIYETVKAPFKDENNEIAGLVGIARDITSRKKAETALLASEERIRLLFESASEGIIYFDRTGIIREVNPEVCSIAAMEREEFIGKHFTALMDSFDLPPQEMFAAYQRALDGNPKSSGEWKIRNKKGERLIINVRPSLIVKDGETIGFSLLAQDVTERKRIEEALRESELLYRSLVESAEDFIYLIDRDMTVRYVNPAGAKTYGATPELIAGKSLSAIFPKKTYEYQRHQLMKVFEKGEPVYVENEFDFPKGRTWFSSLLVPVRNASGEVNIVMGVSRDLTLSKQAEAEKAFLQKQLQQSQKMEAIGTLAGGIAHDFNNMLSVILGNSQLGKLELQSGNLCFSALDEIHAAADRAKDLTMKLLSFSRKEKVSIRRIPVDSILEELAAMLRRSVSKKIEIKTIIEENLPPISIDVNQIHQVFLNICNNACDAMPAGGALTIESHSCSLDEGYSRTHANANPGKYCLVRISDTGIGMPESVVSKIFEPFFTTKGVGKGTGLGLSISYGIVKNHGGHIDVYSEPGKGTSVKVYLPFSADTSAELVQNEEEEELARGSETILVIDDEIMALTLAERTLQRAGYVVITADSGKKAVEIFSEHSSSIALVLSDMVMPEMDGRDVYFALKGIDPKLKFVLSSGYSPDGQAGALLSEGIHGFVQKPYNIFDLCSVVRKVIDG
ncbi:MAG: PAS domain S-box protein [bacterium]